jgi:hypothetical protein
LPKARQRLSRGFLLCLLFRAASRRAEHVAADNDFDAERLAVIGTGFARHTVLRQRPAERLEPLLQRRLVIARERLRAALVERIL